MKFDEDDTLKWVSWILFEKQRLISVDVKSPQTKTTIPYLAITEDNAIQDRNCEDVKRWPKIADIKIPRGGSLAYLRLEECMFIGPTNKFVISLLRQHSLEEL